jgi:signal transduction histidine kinase
VSRLELAKEALQSENTFDVILLDLSLPDETGIATVTSTVSWAGDTPIVILTGLSDEDVSVQAVKHGAQDYILKKEISAFNLARTIRYAIERKSNESAAKRLAVLEQHEEFMATLTHDLKNPLIGSNRILELMANKVMGGVTEEQSALLLKLRDSNLLLLSMIQNLIDVYRFEKDVNAIIVEEIDISDILNACITAISPLASHREIKTTVQISDAAKKIFADMRAIQRVIQNLLDNALKFTPDGGEIRVSVSATADGAVLKVSDTGPGIPPEELQGLFERFAQGRAGRKITPGTGLGLFLCRQIVTAHHGQISCHSVVGEGATFIVTIPPPRDWSSRIN